MDIVTTTLALIVVAAAALLALLVIITLLVAAYDRRAHAARFAHDFTELMGDLRTHDNHSSLLVTR